MASEIISRSDAKAKGLSRYFTGKACKHGHISFRRTVNGTCIECLRNTETRHREKYREKYRDKWRKSSAISRKRDPEAARTRSNKWSRANRSKDVERKRKWRKANPDKHHAAEKRRRDANPDKIRLKNRRYKTANAERLAPIAIERTKQWRLENPEKVRENAAKASQHRRARSLKAVGSYTKKQIDELIEAQNWLCATPRCGSSLRKSKELDHIFALSRGGSNDIGNLQWLCVPCNRKKQHKSPSEWALVCERLFST